MTNDDHYARPTQHQAPDPVFRDRHGRGGSFFQLLPDDGGGGARVFPVAGVVDRDDARGAGDRVAPGGGIVRILRAAAVRGRGGADHAGDEGGGQIIQLRGGVFVGG